MLQACLRCCLAGPGPQSVALLFYSPSSPACSRLPCSSLPCLQARGLTTADVAASASKLRVYRRLRRLDPQAFWQLLRPGSRAVFESRVRRRAGRRLAREGGGWGEGH